MDKESNERDFLRGFPCQCHPHTSITIFFSFPNYAILTDRWLNESKTIPTSWNCYQVAVCFAMTKEINEINMIDNHTVHSPTDAHLLTL